MVIIEGPKGAGKTTLTTSLALQLNLPVYNYAEQLQARGRYSVQEIIMDIRAWGLKPFGIYDGHPFIEEYIYGPIFRKKVAEEFYAWEIRPVIQFMWQNSVVIYCRPTTYPSDNQTALPFYDLLFRTPLLPMQVWEYDFTNEYDLNKITTSIRAYQHAIGMTGNENGKAKRWYHWR